MSGALPGALSTKQLYNGFLFWGGEKKMGNLLVSFPSMVKIAEMMGGRDIKVKVAAKNLSESRQENLHEDLIDPRRNHQVQKNPSTWVQNWEMH